MESIKVAGVEPHQNIFVDTITDDVWVNIIVRNGSANLCISPENAEKLIEALRIAINEVAYERA